MRLSVSQFAQFGPDQVGISVSPACKIEKKLFTILSRVHFLNLFFFQLLTWAKMAFYRITAFFKFTLAKLFEMVECPELELFD